MAYEIDETMLKSNQNAKEKKSSPNSSYPAEFSQKNVRGKANPMNDHTPAEFAKGEHPILKCDFKNRANHKTRHQDP